jgi:hypothetical protein
MKKEYTLAFIGGLFLLAYVLEAVVNPLQQAFPTPYHFLNPTFLASYPFTTAIIAIRSIAIFLTPLWLFSFVQHQHLPKGIILLILAGLMQLYAIQDVATKAGVVPLEWALSLAVAGAALLIPSVWYFLRSGASTVHQKVSGKPRSSTTSPDNDPPVPDWLKE